MTDTRGGGGSNRWRRSSSSGRCRRRGWQPQVTKASSLGGAVNQHAFWFSNCTIQLQSYPRHPTPTHSHGRCCRVASTDPIAGYGTAALCAPGRLSAPSAPPLTQSLCTGSPREAMCVKIATCLGRLVVLAVRMTGKSYTGEGLCDSLQTAFPPLYLHRYHHVRVRIPQQYTCAILVAFRSCSPSDAPKKQSPEGDLIVCVFVRNFKQISSGTARVCAIGGGDGGGAFWRTGPGPAQDAEVSISSERVVRGQ